MLRLVIQASLFTKSILIILLSISIASWAILINKYLFLKNYKEQITKFTRTLAQKGNISIMEDSLIPFSKGAAKTLPLIMIKILRYKSQGGEITSSGAIVKNAAMIEMAKLQRGLGVLATTANVAPLIGLLGTVWGIMYSFINISQHGSASIAVVAPGIAEALITTIAGLCVAIPAMVGHNFLSVWINQCLDNIDRITEFAVALFSDEIKR